MSPAARTRTRRKTRKSAPVAAVEPRAAAAVPALPPEWRDFVGRWLSAAGCEVRDAARGDWEIELSEPLRKRWRRQRVRLVFDPLRATLPRGAWFTAPGSGAGQRVLRAAIEPAMVTHRTALAQVPGAPEDGFASVCRLKNLSWGPARLGPVRYERRVAFHAVVTRWGGLPSAESWIVLLDADGRFVEWAEGSSLPDVRAREGLYQIHEALSSEEREAWMGHARRELDRLLDEREQEWLGQVRRLRDDELDRLGHFFSSRIEEEEERLRRRSSNGDDSEIERGDAVSLKLEWERRAAEVAQRWALRTEVRLWGIEEWAWPVADLEQELRAGAVHLRLEGPVDVARGLPSLPRCPSCGEGAMILLRARGSVACPSCG